MRSEFTRLDSCPESIICKNPHVSPRNLYVGVTSGRLVVHGEVDSYFAKQMAQEALRAEGFNDIDNQLEVIWR